MAGTIADWTFETLPASPAVITAGPYAAEVGAGTATGSHAAVSTYSTPAGNGSVHSYSSNQWQIGDYYQFQVSTVGQSQIGLVFDQTSSATGPRDFKVQYSTNGTTFTDSGFSYSVLANAAPNPLWSTTVPAAGYTKFVDLSTIPAVENQADPISSSRHDDDGACWSDKYIWVRRHRSRRQRTGPQPGARAYVSTARPELHRRPGLRSTKRPLNSV